MTRRCLRGGAAASFGVAQPVVLMRIGDLARAGNRVPTGDASCTTPTAIRPIVMSWKSMACSMIGFRERVTWYGNTLHDLVCDMAGSGSRSWK